MQIRLDPRTKVFLLVVLNLTLISGGISGTAALYKPMLAAIPFILLLTGGRRAAGFTYGLTFTISWLMEHFLLDHLSGLPVMLIAMFTGLFIRWLPCGMMGYYLLSSTRVSEFISAMQRLHISEKIIIPFSVMFRFFPTISEEAAAIKNAMRMRGIHLGGGKGGPAAMLEYRLIPLMMSIVKIGDDLSASAMTRGLGGKEKRTSLCRLYFGKWDICFGAAGFLLFTVFLIT